MSNLHSKFGWISFNGKGEDSITDCEKILGDLFFEKRSLQNVFAGLIYIFKGDLHNLALTLYLSSFRQYLNSGYFQTSTRTDLPIIG